MRTFYSTYEDENESVVSERKKIVVLGSGPIRIGQGVEFDYSTVRAVRTIQAAGYEAIIINNNPETVSTDYTCSDKLYFEPLTPEDVMNIIQLEQPEGVIATLGGQTAINLAQPLMERGVKIIGTDCAAIERAENRDAFERLLLELGIPQPKGRAVTDIEAGVRAAAEIGYPVLVRPSFVLGGRAMQIVAKEEALREYLKTAVEIDADKPVLVDQYIRGREVEVDAICDGSQVFVPGIMELVERTGVHSGDSISVYPPFSISEAVKRTILDYTQKLGLGIGIKGLFNIQFIVDERDNVYIIEVNPRSSRTVPFLSKATGCALPDIAAMVNLGVSLSEQGITEICPREKDRWYVKAPAFSFSKLQGMDAYLSPEMKSTGEAIGYDKKLHRAMYKALVASGVHMLNYGTVIVTLVYIIEVNPRSSRTVPFLSKATGCALPDIAAMVNLGVSLSEQGITEICPREKDRWYVKAPAFSFSKLQGMDAYLSPEMKSTGEAIGYDKKLHRAMYKALVASGVHMLNYGTVIVTLADEDKEEALPLVRRFYEMGFNIEATTMTAQFLKKHGIRTRVRKKLSEGSEEISAPESARSSAKVVKKYWNPFGPDM